MARIPKWLIDQERRLLADALQSARQPAPRKRKLRLRKLSDHVVRTWVSAGCFGEVVQWSLAPKKKTKKKTKKKKGR